MLTTSISVISLLLLVYLLLWLPPVQQKLKDIALNQVMAITGNKMKIGKLEFRPFNQLKLQDVYVADLKGDTLLYAQSLSARFDLIKLFQNHLQITAVDLDNFYIHLQKADKNAPFNYQFFVDAFASNDTVKSTGKGMIIEIDQIKLNQGTLAYNVLSEKALDAGLFDPNHILILDFQTEISLKSIDIEQLDVAIQSLSFAEKSGVKVNEFQLALQSKGKNIHLKDFNLQFPHSSIHIPLLDLGYEGMDLSKLTQGATYNLSVKIDSLSPLDFRAFYPSLDQWDDTLRLEALVAGKLPEIGLDKLSASYGEQASLEMQAFLQDFNRWQDSGLEVEIHKLFVGHENFGYNRPIQLSGHILGSLPDLSLQLETLSDASRLDVNGKVGYVDSTKQAQFDLDVKAKNIDLKNLLKGNNDFGRVDFNLSTKGRTDKKRGIQAVADMSIAHVDYKQYAYRDIKLKAAYKGDSISGLLVSKDTNARVNLNFRAGMRSSRLQSVDLSAVLDHVRLDTLNLLEMYKGAELTTAFNVQLDGLNPESAHLLFVMDSLQFKTEKGVFSEGRNEWRYDGLPGNEKKLDIVGGIFNVGLEGQFTFKSLIASFQHSLSYYFPDIFPILPKKKPLISNDSLNFWVTIQNVDSLSKLINLPFSIVDSSYFQGKYQADSHYLELHSKINRLKYGDMFWDKTFLDLKSDASKHQLQVQVGSSRYYETPDTFQVKLQLQNFERGVSILLGINSQTPTLDMQGKLSADLHFFPDQKLDSQKLVLSLNPSLFLINRDTFQIHPSTLQMEGKRYSVENFTISHSESEFLKIDGSVSSDSMDSLEVNLSQIDLKTITNALNLGLDLTGKANGKILANQLLTSPLLMTEDFSIKDIFLKGKEIGTLNMVSTWNNERKGLFFNVGLERKEALPSTLSGYLLPGKDSVLINADVQSILLDWLSPFTEGTLFGLKGELGAKIKIGGKLKAPRTNGYLYVRDGSFGINMLNTRYNLSDTIFIEPGLISFRDFKIKDENDRALSIKGDVKHDFLKSLDPKLKIDVQDFQVLNNPGQTDSLFFGTLKLNGSIDLANTGKDLLVRASLKNSPGSRIMVNLPQSSGEAQRYSSITFIDPNKKAEEEVIPPPKTNLSLPVRMNLSLAINPDLKLGAIYNPVTKDSATVSGNGNLDFEYNLNTSKMNLLGDYIVKNGQAVISLRNITRKVFTVQEGGKLSFRGDPAATVFDVTAVYSLRADLSTLDSDFSDMMSNTKVPVNCLLTASGNASTMKLSYEIELPNEKEEIKRKASGLMSSDEMKIKEIAYLLAFSTFYPVNSDDPATKSNIWTSLASSSMTNQLNNLLSGVLNENWTIGTELHSNDSKFSDVEMEVNVSTRLFNNRLIVNSNIGYRNEVDAGASSNFTGDFDLQYKLTKPGDIVLKVYNETNDKYYEKAKTTQGVGIIYQKESRTFKGLFERLLRKLKK